LDGYVIKADRGWKRVFDVALLVCAVYNVFANAYYAAFRPPLRTYEFVLDLGMEVVFLLDMLFCFFQEFVDEETWHLVSKFKPIALRYAGSTLVFDLVAWIPYDYIFFPETMHTTDLKLLRLAKLLRIPRMLAVLDNEKFRGLLSRYYDG
jgi:hypothetical protein